MVEGLSHHLQGVLIALAASQAAEHLLEPGTG
jgi:hypothetical protein